MKLYFAPMEGITSYAFRQVHHRFFPGMDRYYTPFLAATQTHSFKKKEIREILPENNQRLLIIPQILGNHAEDCLAAIRTLASYGYRDINFNLGCSMPQVANRGRGAGFLGKPEQLDAFFEELFDGMRKDETLAEAGVGLSVKTRIGDKDPGEAADLLAIYNRYPIKELIVHPRLRTDLYKNTPDLGVFNMFYEDCHHPLCYNGDILSLAAYQEICSRFPNLQAVMLGRGLIMDPSLAEQIREAEASDWPASGENPGNRHAGDGYANGEYADGLHVGGEPVNSGTSGGGSACCNPIRSNAAADGWQLEKYLLALRDGYLSYMQSDQQVLPHLKEIWFYMAWHYDRGIQDSRDMKNLRKARAWSDFAQAQHLLLQLW